MEHGMTFLFQKSDKFVNYQIPFGSILAESGVTYPLPINYIQLSDCIFPFMSFAPSTRVVRVSTKISINGSRRD